MSKSARGRGAAGDLIGAIIDVLPPGYKVFRKVSGFGRGKPMPRPRVIAKRGSGLWLTGEIPRAGYGQVAIRRSRVLKKN